MDTVADTTILMMESCSSNCLKQNVQEKGLKKLGLAGIDWVSQVTGNNN